MLKKLSQDEIRRKVENLLHQYDFSDCKGSLGAYIYNNNINFYISNSTFGTPEPLYNSWEGLIYIDFTEDIKAYKSKMINKKDLIKSIQSDLNDKIEELNEELEEAQ